MAVPITLPLTGSLMVMVLPGSPLPLSVGVASSVTVLSGLLALLAPTSSVAVTMVGGRGAVVSITKGNTPVVLGAPVLSGPVAVNSWGPSGSSSVGVKVHLPSAMTVAVPSTVSPSLMVTTVPGVPRPSMVGVVSLVTPLGCTRPEVGATLSLTSTMLIGVLLLSMLKGSGSERPLVLPEGSVNSTLMGCVPSASGEVGLKLHSPVGSTVALPIRTPLS